MAEENVEMITEDAPETTEESAGRGRAPARGGRAPPGARRGRAPPGRGRPPPGRGRAPPPKKDDDTPSEDKKDDDKPSDADPEAGDDAEDGSDAKPGGLKPQIIIKKFNAVAKWTQGDGMHTHCAICRNNLMDLCIEAHGSGKGCDEQNGTCLIAVGQCQHHFHNCCLSRFLKDHSTCPACGGRDWVLHHLDKQV